MTPPTDRELMREWVSDRDPAVMEQLVRRWQHRLYVFFYKTTDDADAAEDLRQEVFERVWRFAGSYDGTYAFSTWIFKIATNVLRTWLAARKRSREVVADEVDSNELPEPVDHAPGPFEKAHQSEYRDMLAAQMNRLDAESRELLLLRFDQDLTYAQIAQIRQEPETTVKSRIYKILGDLRKAMNRLEQPERMETP